jgi:hypothetical protein
MTSFGYNVLGFGVNPDEIFEITISSNVDNFNLATHLSSNTTYNGSNPADFYVTINSGVVVGGFPEGTTYSSTSPTFGDGSPYDNDYYINKTGIAFDTGSLGTGSRLFITNNGTILGFGGRGGTLDGNGTATHPDGRLYRDGGNGGTAFKTTITTFFTNNGKLQGGGGGGSAGAVVPTAGGSGGGGGAGAAPGLGGAKVGIDGANGNGQNGTETAGASGGGGSRAGGAGGGPGQDGGTGLSEGGVVTPPGNAGSAGNYIEGNSLTTFLVTGTRAGGVA